MTTGLWKRCLDQLEEELPPQQFNTWIRPLQAVQDPQALRLLAPNRFVVDWVRQRFLTRIGELVGQYAGGSLPVMVEVGSQMHESRVAEINVAPTPRRAGSSLG